MKFTIFYQKDEGIARTSQIAPQIEYEFTDLSVPVSEHIVNISRQFEESGVVVDRCTDCCLLTKKEKPIDKTESLAAQLVESEKEHLTLSLHPCFKARKIINLLKDNAKVKETVFYLKTKLENIYFAEEFISAGGVPVLVDTASATSGNTQAYTLAALHTALFHLQGIRVFLETEDLTQKLCLLLDSPIISVCRQTLELLVLICTFDEKGAQKVNKVAETDEKSFGQLLRLAESGDLDTQINSLTVINCLIASSGIDQTEQLSRFNQNGDINSILRSLVTIENPLFRNQLRLFEDLTKITILDGPKAPESKKKQKEFIQPLFPAMRKEFNRSQRKMNDLLKLGEFLPVSVQTPLRCYARQLTQLDTNLSSAFRDEDKLQQTISELENEVSNLQSKLKSAKMKNRKHKKNMMASDEGGDTKKRRKHRTGALDESQGAYEGKIRILKEKLKAQGKELEISRQQQNEASANVKKLAQVVKLMKTKYDTLKANVDESLVHSEEILPDSLTPREASQLGFSGEEYFAPIHIDVEELVVIHHGEGGSAVSEQMLFELTEEKEKLKKDKQMLEEKIAQVASLDSLTNLIVDPISNTTEALPIECLLLSWRYVSKGEIGAEECFWSEIPPPKDRTYDDIVPLFKDEVVEFLSNGDQFKITKEQIMGLAKLDKERIRNIAEEPVTDGQKIISRLYSSIPNFYEKIFCWHFVATFEEQCVLIENRMHVINSAIEEMRTSSSLKTCLSNLVQVGKEYQHMDIFGIYPDSLLNSLIADDHKILKQVLHRLEQEADNFPVEFLPIELPNLFAASTIDLFAIQDDIKRLEMQRVQNDEYSKLFEESFLRLDDTTYQQEMDRLQEAWRYTKETFSDIVLYFTCDASYASQIPSQLFFYSFDRFVKELQRNNSST